MDEPATTETTRRPVAPRTARLAALALLPAAALFLSACGSSGNSGSSTTTTTVAPTGTAAAGPHDLVTTVSVGGLGKILVDSEDQVLYTFTTAGKPVPCDPSCLAAWPPLTLPAGVTTPIGAAGVGTLGTTTANGVTQVTVNGLPLFTYAGDSGPGVANGNDVVSFGGTWKVVKAS